MVEIDHEQLNVLMDACKQAYPDIDPYVIWVYSLDYLLNQIKINHPSQSVFFLIGNGTVSISLGKTIL